MVFAAFIFVNTLLYGFDSAIQVIIEIKLIERKEKEDKDRRVM